MFSAYVLGIKCVTTTDNDGCCIKSKSHGAICLVKNSTDARTYRINEDDWTTVSALNQNSMVGNADFDGSIVPNNDAEIAIGYMDYAVCTNQPNFECLMW